MPQSFKKRQNNARISSERNYTTVAADQPKLGTFVGCISQEMSFSMSSILAPNVGTNPVPVPSTTQSLNPVLGPSQWSWSNCQPVSLAPANPHSAHQPQLSQGVFLMPAVPQAQGVAYQPGSYTPALWHAFPTTYMLQPTEGTPAFLQNPGGPLETATRLAQHT